MGWRGRGGGAAAFGSHWLSWQSVGLIIFPAIPRSRVREIRVPRMWLYSALLASGQPRGMHCHAGRVGGPTPAHCPVLCAVQTANLSDSAQINRARFQTGPAGPCAPGTQPRRPKRTNTRLSNQTLAFGHRPSSRVPRL